MSPPYPTYAEARRKETRISRPVHDADVDRAVHGEPSVADGWRNAGV